MTDILGEIAEAWGWTGIEPVEILRENDFGNVLVRSREGRFWRICPEDLTCEIVAASEGDLESLLANADFLLDWEMEALVRVAVDKLGNLETGYKFGLITPGPLGGAYAAENIMSVPFFEVLGVSGSLARQIDGLPNGARLRVVVE